MDADIDTTGPAGPAVPGGGGGGGGGGRVVGRPAVHRRQGAPLLAVTVIALVQMCLVLLFAWSSSRATPHELPVAVAGPTASVQGLAAGLQQARPGALAITALSDDAAARSAVTERRVYGAVVLGQGGATVYTATAASPAVAQALAELLPAVLQKAVPGAAVTVTDLAPAPVDDPRGAAFAGGLIPLVVTSIAAGAAVGLLAGSRRSRVVALLGFAVLAGAVSNAALSGLGVLPGSGSAEAGVLALACLAVAGATAGLVALAGVAGAGLSILVVFFFGFPFSGATSAWRLMPTPWGLLAQYLPVGALNTALRSVAFFGGAGATGALMVLAGWAVVGTAIAATVRRPVVGH